MQASDWKTIKKPAWLIAEDWMGEFILYDGEFHEIINVSKDVPHGALTFELKGVGVLLTVEFTKELEVW